MKNELTLVHGAGDIVARLEEAIVDAREGRLEAVVIIGITPGDGLYSGTNGWTGAAVDNMIFPYPRILTAVSHAYYDLQKDGIADWT